MSEDIRDFCRSVIATLRIQVRKNPDEWRDATLEEKVDKILDRLQASRVTVEAVREVLSTIPPGCEGHQLFPHWIANGLNRIAALPQVTQPRSGITLDPCFGDPFIWIDGADHSEALESDDWILIKAPMLRALKLLPKQETHPRKTKRGTGPSARAAK